MSEPEKARGWLRIDANRFQVIFHPCVPPRASCAIRASLGRFCGSSAAALILLLRLRDKLVKVLGPDAEAMADLVVLDLVGVKEFSYEAAAEAKNAGNFLDTQQWVYGFWVFHLSHGLQISFRSAALPP